MLRITLVAVALVVPLASFVVADDAPVLTPSDPTVTWQGRFFDAGATPHGALCTSATCDSFAFEVALPEGMRAHRGVSLEVSIRWTSEQNDFELFLYDAGGALVAESTGMISTAEGLLVPHVAPGAYTAVVAPGTVSASAYEGLAQLEFERPLHGELVPDLVTLPPSGLRVVAPVYFTGTPLEAAPISCGADETAEAGVTRCLRFSNAIANLGDGPLEARFDSQGVPLGLAGDESARPIAQRLYSADGTWRERLAGHYTFHAVHAHFHYEDFAEHTLYRVTPDGLVVASEGRKAGFCMVDVAIATWAEQGNEARTYKAPVCLAPTDGTELVQGISVGWADVYTWDLPDQYVDITGLEDGCYRLETVADPSAYFTELRTDNNAAWVELTLEGDSVRVGC